jgi:hypothetical protein
VSGRRRLALLLGLAFSVLLVNLGGMRDPLFEGIWEGEDEVDSIYYWGSKSHPIVVNHWAILGDACFGY